MPRSTRLIDASSDQIENAKETAVALIGETNSKMAMDLFYTDNLEEIEQGIRNLNEFSNKSWLISAILLFTLIYNKNLYAQSGLEWAEYAKQSRERLGIDQRDITEQLSASEFFIRYHKQLERAHFNPVGANRKLARANLALELSGDLSAVIKHICNDSFMDFKTWYQSFKQTKALPKLNENVRDDIGYKGNKFTIKGIEAVTISDKIPPEERQRLQKYMKTIFEAIANGYEPAIIPVYDKKEAVVLERLRDKHRQGK